jgi:hypothetical protein
MWLESELGIDPTALQPGNRAVAAMRDRLMELQP